MIVLSHVRPQNVHMRFSPHPLPFLFDAKSRTTRIIAWKIAQLSTWQKWGHMIGYQLTLVGIPGLAGNLKIT